MKVSILLFLALFYLKGLRCQIIGKIYDKSNRRGIAYAMVIDRDSLFCVFSDSVGKFCINQNLLKSNLELYIRAPNYSPQKIQGITSNFEIELNPFHENFPKIKSNEVPVNNKGRLKEIGIPKLNLINPVFGSKAYENTEIALRMPNKGRKTGLMQSVSVFIRSSGVYYAPFRLKIYSLSNSQTPENDLLHEDIILYGYKKDAWNIYDISKYGIIFPKEGCFVSIEWLNIDCSKYHYPLKDGNQGLGICIGLTDSYDSFTSYKRYNRKDWQKVGAIFWDGFRLVDYNPMINIDVLFYNR